MANVRLLLKSHEKLIFLPFLASSKRRRERRDGFQSCELEKLVLALGAIWWWCFHVLQFKCCIHNCEYLRWEKKKKKKRLEKRPWTNVERLLCWTLNIYLSRLCMQTNERWWRFFYSASITLNSTNGHLQCLFVWLIPSPCHCPESFLRNVRPLFENNQF